MKTLVLAMAMLCISNSFGLNAFASQTNEPVNTVLGDASFLYTFGHYPDEQTDETLRLATHLSYVESLLRARDVADWPFELVRKREQVLDLLHDYWTAAQFPHNLDYVNTRRPCFIDRDGNICAVGYLVEKTAGRAAAESINATHQYDYVLEMNDPLVSAWICESGLTELECAMIQPEYEYYSEECYTNEISKRYGVLSGLLGGASLSLGVANGIQIWHETNNSLVPSLGIVAGGAQIILGATNYPDNVCVNHAKENLSIANIGLGAATIGLSIWNLTTKKSQQNSKMSWNLFSYPTTDEQDTGVGFSLARQL